MESRTLPNILITGTPGTGKSTLADAVAREFDGVLNYIDLGKLVKAKELHDGYDAEFDTYILNEDKVCDELEDTMQKGGNILEAHSCDYFPERWFDLVVVLRADNTVLYDRLAARSYSQKKIEENVEAEIMQVVLDEVRGSYKNEITVVLQSDTIDQMVSNSQRVVTWVRQWIENNKQ